MAFKVRTEVKPETGEVPFDQVPQDFRTAFAAEYKAVSADPTREIVLSGESKEETALLIKWAKAWGANHEPALLITKQPARKSDAELDARLAIVEKSKATPRGRKPASDTAGK